MNLHKNIDDYSELNLGTCSFPYMGQDPKVFPVMFSSGLVFNIALCVKGGSEEKALCLVYLQEFIEILSS